MVDVARGRRSLPVEELDEQVAARLGIDLDDPTVELLLDRVSDTVIGRDGPRELLADDRVVHVESLLDGIVLTHRLTQDEIDRGALVLDLGSLDLGSLDLDALVAGSASDAPGPGVQEAMLAFFASQEQSWCEESVPALDGLTPAQAAADPTRRDDLIRLIDSFPTVDPSSGAFTFRPERLRELLDLPARG